MLIHANVICQLFFAILKSTVYKRQTWRADTKQFKSGKQIKRNHFRICRRAWVESFLQSVLFSAFLTLAVIKEGRFCQTRGLACLVVMGGVVIRLQEVEALED